MSDAPLVPAPRENLIALRDRREQVIAALTEHFSRDVIDLDDFERRIDLAHRARTVAELDQILADLGPIETSTALVPQPTEDALASWPTKKRWLAIMGGFQKKGRWSVPRKMRTVCFWGGGQLDFREAEFAPGVTELHVTTIMGGLEIIVPPWLAIETDSTAIMGGFEELDRGHGAPDPGRALLRITGFALMGGVSIATRLPGESGSDARKRIKKERKALASASQRRLGDGSDKP